MITVRWAEEQVKFPQVEFRRIFHQIKRPVPPDAEMITAYTDGQVTRRSARAREGGYHEAADMSGMQGVHVGDFVVHGLDIMRGSVGISDSTGAISAVCILCEANDKADPRYFGWVIRAMSFTGFPKALARGVREGGADFRRWDTLAELPVPCPPVDVQSRISDFLDKETKRIDGLIAMRQQMASMLELRMATLMRELVTGARTFSEEGDQTTDPVASDLPHGWALVRARFLCDIYTGGSDTDQSVVEGEYPFYVRSQSPERSSRYLFDGEAVLTAGDGAGVGKVFHYVRGKFDAHQRVYVLRNFRTVSGRYFFYCFKALFSITALDGSAKSTVDSVRRHMISDMNIPVPPAETQAEIVKEIQSAEDSTELLVTKIREQVSLLQERRQALITAAVTGQLEI